MTLLRSLFAAVFLLAGGASRGDPALLGVVTHVVDGDTIDVDLDSGPIRVRLDSVDAPEKSQPFGDAARQALERLVDGREVALVPVTQDRYERMVAVVFIGELEVNLELVRNGYAWAFRGYLKDPKYCAAERYAREQGLGLWASAFAPARAPWEWRAYTRGERESFTDYSTSAPDDCAPKVRPARAPSRDSDPAVAPVLRDALRLVLPSYVSPTVVGEVGGTVSATAP